MNIHVGVECYDFFQETVRRFFRSKQIKGSEVLMKFSCEISNKVRFFLMFKKTFLIRKKKNVKIDSSSAT